jgi:hypothetical protein
MENTVQSTTRTIASTKEASAKSNQRISGRFRVGRSKLAPNSHRGEERVISRFSMRITLEDRLKIRRVISSVIDDNGIPLFNSAIDFNHEAIAQFLQRRPFMSHEFVAPEMKAATSRAETYEMKPSEAWVTYLMEMEPRYENAMEDWRVEYERRTGKRISRASWALSCIRFFFKLLEV